MTSLAYIFTMEKSLVKIIFGRKFFICQPIFIFFLALLKTFGIHRNDKITFAIDVPGQGDMQKGSFQRMV